MRPTAALALNVSDLHLDNCSLVTCCKHARIHDARYPKAVARLLRRHLREQGGGTGGAVFRSSRRGRLSARQVQYRFRRILELAGINRPVTVHSLRHTFATRLAARSKDLTTVQIAMGHQHLQTTAIYASRR